MFVVELVLGEVVDGSPQLLGVVHLHRTAQVRVDQIRPLICEDKENNAFHS